MMQKSYFVTMASPRRPEELPHHLRKLSKRPRGFGLPVVIKAQVLVGGRGLAEGIRFAARREDVHRQAEAALNATIKGL